MGDKLNITPTTNLLKSLRGERTDYIILIGEGVDNSLDAGASIVRVTVAEHSVTIEDNGVGLTRDRVRSLFSLGDHGVMPTTQLGRFGIGIKSQAVNAGDILRVDSTSKDGHVVTSVDWTRVLLGGRWEIDAPFWVANTMGKSTGTTIVIDKLRHSCKTAMERIRSELAQIFYPAINNGKQIIVNDISVEALAEPIMTDMVQLMLSLSGDRSAHLRAGVLAEPSKLNRVHVSFRHRVIKPASTLGCGEYTGLSKMFARVQLSGPWRLAKFKNDLTDDGERDELDRAVEDALRPILMRCSSSHMSAKISKMTRLLNDMVPSEIAPARPHSKKKEETAGAKKGKSKQGVVDQEKADLSGGPARAKRSPRDTLMITFEADAGQHGIGTFEAGESGKPHRVDLAKDDPFVKELLAHRDEAFGSRCLLATALMLFEEGRLTNDPQHHLGVIPFGRRIAVNLGMQDRDGDKRILR